MLRKTTYHLVTLAVEFSEEEKQIIRANQLERTILMERNPPANEDPAKYEKPTGLAKGLFKLATGAENPCILRISTLLKGKDTYITPTPIDAREYEMELKEKILPTLKGYLLGNTEITEKSSTFEL